MTIARSYRMIAAAGQADTLEAALRALAGTVRGLPGCEGVTLLRDTARPDIFGFVERWQSIAAHKDAGKALPKDAFARVMAALASPPEGSYCEELASL